MRKVKVVLLAMVLLAMVAGCAGLQAKWDKATPQEKARIVLNDIQDSLNVAFDAGKDYITLHPEKKADWQKKIIPMFDLANKSIKDYLTGMSSQWTVQDVLLKVQPKVGEIISILASWGVNIKIKSKEV